MEKGKAQAGLPAPSVAEVAGSCSLFPPQQGVVGRRVGAAWEWVVGSIVSPHSCRAGRSARPGPGAYCGVVWMPNRRVRETGIDVVVRIVRLGWAAAYRLFRGLWRPLCKPAGNESVRERALAPH